MSLQYTCFRIPLLEVHRGLCSYWPDHIYRVGFNGSRATPQPMTGQNSYTGDCWLVVISWHIDYPRNFAFLCFRLSPQPDFGSCS